MTALEESLAGPKRHRNSCFQCKRRKQKCDRIWPCTPCARRDESMDCSFTGAGVESRRSIAKNTKAARKIRHRKIPSATKAALLQTGEEISSTAVVQAADTEDQPNGDGELNLDSECPKQHISSSPTVQSDDSHCHECQYPEQQPAALEVGAEVKPPPFEKRHDDQYSRSASDCEQLQKALEALPQRRDRMDALVLSFFQNVNPHYGLIHQAEFAAEYAVWWKRREKNEPLPLPWTCLLLMLCACACQHLPVDIQEKLEEMFHRRCQDLTEDYHYRTRMLYGEIPEGQYYRHNVMWMLHSTYWYKAEAMFSECCHVFYTAVREAQELGFNNEERSEHLPSFEREMRRRAWCIIDSWDWQIASGLGRDTLVDHSACHVQRPSLTLELEGQFSPLMHMNMQSDLVHKLAKRFHSPAKINTPSEVMEYKEMIDEWMRNFPAIFALENPDTSHDEEQTWIEYHRYYNYTMGFMMLLNPFRPHMKQPVEKDAPEDQLKLRTIAVNMSIRLVKVLDDWVNYLTFRDGRFHFIIFSLVDATTMLADVIRNDKAGTATRRYEMYQTLEKSRLLQGKLQCLSKSAKGGFRIVSRTFKKLMKDAPEEDYIYLPDGKDDTEQEVLRAAMESISLSAENRIASGKQKQKARAAVAEVDSARPGLQSFLFSHSENCQECQENHEHGGHGALESAHYGIPVTGLPDHGGQKLPGHSVAASEEHILPTSSTYDLAAPASYGATLPPTVFAATSSYIEPPQTSNYKEPLPLEYATSTSPDYSTAALLIDPTTASAYVEPFASGHLGSAPPGDVGAAFSNDVPLAPFVYDTTLPVDYGIIASSNFDPSLSSGYSNTVPPYADAMLPVYNAFAYLGNTGVMSAETLTANTLLFDAPTTFGSTAAPQMRPFSGYDATGLDTTYGSYSNTPARSQDLASGTVPMTYATPASSVSHSSPENYPYSESYNASTLYNTAVPYSDPAICIDSATSLTSPESTSSSANFDAAEAQTAAAATATSGFYAHTEYSQDTVQQHRQF